MKISIAQKQIKPPTTDAADPPAEAEAEAETTPADSVPGEDSSVITIEDDDTTPKVHTITVPFVYGSIAYVLPQRLPNGHTHTWTVYLRPYNNEDMSRYINKVEFKLHESFEKPTRICTTLPYEVTETGWGEFIVGIRIFFRDRTTCSRPLVTEHFLKLYEITNTEPYDPSHPPPLPSPGHPIINEHYDEFIMASPSADLISQLEEAKKWTSPDWVAPYNDWEALGLNQLKEITTAQTVVREKIEETKVKLQRVKQQCEAMLKMKKDRERQQLEG